MTDTKELKIALLRSDMTASELADAIGISRVSFSYKMNNLRQFTVPDISKIAEVLNLSISDKDRIFFAKKVE